MPDSITFTYRGQCIEDLQTSSTLTTVTLPVLGLGPTQLTPFVAVQDDPTALSAGLNPGDVYISTATAPFRLHSVVQGGSGGGGGGGGLVNLTGQSLITVGVVADGVAFALGSQISVPGAALGDPVRVGTNPALPTGVIAIGKVTAPAVVTVELWSLFGGPTTLGAFLFKAQVIR